MIYRYCNMTTNMTASLCSATRLPSTINTTLAIPCVPQRKCAAHVADKNVSPTQGQTTTQSYSSSINSRVLSGPMPVMYTLCAKQFVDPEAPGLSRHVIVEPPPPPPCVIARKWPCTVRPLQHLLYAGTIVPVVALLLHRLSLFEQLQYQLTRSYSAASRFALFLLHSIAAVKA